MKIEVQKDPLQIAIDAMRLWCKAAPGRDLKRARIAFIEAISGPGIRYTVRLRAGNVSYTASDYRRVSERVGDKVAYDAAALTACFESARKDAEEGEMHAEPIKEIA